MCADKQVYRPLHKFDKIIHPGKLTAFCRFCLFESFVSFPDTWKEDVDAGPIKHTAIAVICSRQFTPVFEYLAGGLSFWQVLRVLTIKKKVFGNESIGFCYIWTEKTCSCLICVIFGENVWEVLRKTWAFSIALDMAANMRQRTTIPALASTTMVLYMGFISYPSQ